MIHYRQVSDLVVLIDPAMVLIGVFDCCWEDGGQMP